MDATICERQEDGGQAEVPSRDGVCLTTVRLAVSEAKREELAVKGLEHSSAPVANHEEQTMLLELR